MYEHDLQRKKLALHLLCLVLMTQQRRGLEESDVIDDCGVVTDLLSVSSASESWNSSSSLSSVWCEIHTYIHTDRQTDIHRVG